MIKPEEFRIGNYILTQPGSDSFFIVEQIDLSKERSFKIKSLHDNKEEWYAIAELFPAILNEDWLNNFSFIKEEYQEDRSPNVFISWNSEIMSLFILIKRNIIMNFWAMITKKSLLK